MARFTEISLDDVKYKVPTLSIDQLERIGAIYTNPETKNKPGAGSFDLFKIILEDVDPPIADPKGPRCSGQEMKDAMQTVLGAAGLQPPENPPVPAAPAAGDPPAEVKPS